MSAEPEEMSMNEVLSSIRQMLSDGEEMPEAEKLDTEIEEVFVLTPAMRVSQTSALTIQEKMKMALNKLAEQRPTKTPEEYKNLMRAELQPILKEWLQEQLSALIEKALDEEVNKLFA